MRHDSVKKLRPAACIACRRPYTTGHPREKGAATRELAKAAASIAVDVGPGSLAGTTRTPRLDQRAATFFFLPFGAPAAAFGAGHGAW
jgi:hypothetical protein